MAFRKYAPAASAIFLAVIAVSAFNWIPIAFASLIMTPVAIQVASAMNSNPRAFALAVIVGASASFIMSAGHPAPLLVRKPGKYKNSDYLKFEAVAALLVLIVITLVVPLFFPL